jgi:hypothetical protein
VRVVRRWLVSVDNVIDRTWCANSYDLDLDKRLAEDTTVLVENYTVGCDERTDSCPS